MPYFITDDAEGCDGFATIKEDGEVIGCHTTKAAALAQMIAVSLAEGIEPGGERQKKKKKKMQYRALPEHYRPATSPDVPEGRACGNCFFFNEEDVAPDGRARCMKWNEYVSGGFVCNAWQPSDEARVPVPGKDKFTTEAEALDRAQQIGCSGTHSMDENGETIFMPCSTHAAYDKIMNTNSYEEERAPAPKKEQIKGSDKNAPGSAKGAGTDITFSAATETALRNKVTDHNESMAEQGKPAHTRTTLGRLKSVYRRGSGAYSTSFRPGISRAAWSMARVNAFLYLLRNGRPENPKYITDNDLLPEGHPKSSRSLPFDAVENRQEIEVPDYIRANAEQGLRWHREGFSGDGLQQATVREAAAMTRGDITEDKVRRMAAWFARHMSDLASPSAKPGHPDYPSPGIVAHALWGGGTRDKSIQTMAWAESKVKALDSEERHASHDQLSHGSHRLSGYGQVADEQSGYRNSLNAEQSTAVEEYQSRGFISLNESLRSNNEMSASDTKTMVQLDKTIANVPSFTSEKTFARGIDGEAKERLFANAQPGDIVSDSGFLSTTADESVAKSFATSDGAKIIIKAPAGTRGFAVGEGPDKIITSESEVLFGRNTKLKVLSIDVSTNSITVEVQP